MPKFKTLAACVSLIALSLPFSSEAGVVVTNEWTTTGTPATIGMDNGVGGTEDLSWLLG